MEFRAGVTVSSDLWKEISAKIDKIISLEQVSSTKDNTIVERVLEYAVPNDPKLMTDILKQLEDIAQINVTEFV